MLTIINPLNIEGYTVYRDDAIDLANIDAGVEAALKRDHDHVASLDPAAASSSGTPTGATAAALPPSMRFYVLPNAPSIAFDEGGKPIFSLIVYRRADARIDPATAGKDDVGGGILTFTVELAVPDEVMQRIVGKLRALVYGDGADASSNIELSQVEFLDGKVSVAVAGEGTDTSTGHEFVKGAVGTGKVSGVGANRKAVMVNLTQDGASLMSQIDKLRTLPINVAYDLSFEHRLLGVRMRVWCDVTSSYHLVQTPESEVTGQTGGYLGTGLGSSDVLAEKIANVTEVCLRSKTAGVEVVPQTSQVDNDTILSLEKFGEDMLSKHLEKVIEAMPPSDKVDRNYLQQYFSDANDEFNFTLDRRMVLVRNYSPSANISNILNRGDLSDLVAWVDLDTAFFSLLKVPIRVNADFSKLPISSVVVTLEYRSKKLDGSGMEDRVQSFEFTDGAKVQTFITYANSLDLVTYNWTASVHYRDSQEPYEFRKNSVKDRFLVVDVGTLGLIAVDIGFGLVDLEKFPEASITVRYRARSTGLGVEQTFKLDRDNQSALWTDVVREESSGSYDYKVDWLRKSDDAILPGQWITSDGTHGDNLRLKLDAPVPDHMDVSVVCSGNFKDGQDPISHVVVSLEYSDPDNAYTQDGRIDFTDDKQLQTWSVDLRNAQLRDYRYRYDIIYKGGLVKHFPPDGKSWLTGQPGFITVGEKYLIEVNLFPYLLQFGDREKVVQVDLRYVDPDHHIDAKDSFVFNKDNAGNRTWRVTGDPAGPRSYQVDISYYAAGGTVTKLPTRSADGEAVVIPPLPQPAPSGGAPTGHG